MTNTNQILQQKRGEPVPINDWLAVKGNTQTKLARFFNLNTTSVWAWQHRDVWVCETSDGFEVFEIKQLPNPKLKSRRL
jgi:hypothetical protein